MPRVRRSARVHAPVEQGVLLDLGARPRLRPLDAASVVRTELSDGAWVDVRRNWLEGADTVFAALTERAAWREEERPMYDRVVAVPRLVAFYDDLRAVPHDVVPRMAAALDEHYRDVLPDGFRTAGLCLYRSGDDSVAWHGDRFGRGRDEDTLVAIVSLGAPRALSLRPRGGGPSRRITMASGDLLVMGGSCQRTWDHAVLKTSRPVGPRISVQLRPPGVR